MDYGSLISRAGDIIWKHKFLIVLGVLVALGSAGGGSSSQRGLSGVEQGLEFPRRAFFDFQGPFQDLGLPVLPTLGILAVGAVILFIAIPLWVLSTISRGGLIYGANLIANGEETGFSESFQAGWEKGWRLVGIGILPAIPGFVLFIVGFLSLGLYRHVEVIQVGERVRFLANIWSFIPAITLVCLFLTLSLLLILLRTFANRACMLEDLGVVASYRRGFEVLGANLGPAFILFLLQIAISIGVGLALFIPGILILLCCFLWPLLLLIQGTFAAFYSTLWTLAWNEWRGRVE